MHINLLQFKESLIALIISVIRHSVLMTYQRNCRKQFQIIQTQLKKKAVVLNKF